MGAPQLFPARPSEDTERLVRLLLADPAVAGRLRDVRLGELAPNYSGAFLLHGTWADQPAIAKIGATPREVRWTRELARVDPSLIPTLHASGDVLGEEALAWLVMERCQVEMCHGDLHPANAVSRAAPPDPAARALLIDHAPSPMPWASEPARCEVLYWRTQTPNGEPTLVHAMAAFRQSHGLATASPKDLDRLATLFLAWHALRLWPYARHRLQPHRAEYPEAVRAYMEAAAT